MTGLLRWMGLRVLPPLLLAVLVVAAWPLSQLALLALAICIMPWVAAGDSIASVWRRSLRLTYWATTILVPASAAAILARCGLGDFVPKLRDGDMVTVIALSLTAAVLVAMFVRMLFFGGHAYVGAPDGPAFSPREPRCEDCGYLLLGLPLDTRCPECGTPVADSLPAGRRKPLDWHRNARKPRGLADLLRLHVFILHDGRFFRFVPIHDQLRIARYFWWMSFGLMCGITLAVAQVVSRLFPAYGLFRSNINASALGILLLMFALHNLMMLPACLWAQLRHGIRDYRVSATVCCYGVPLWWPFILAAMTAAILANNPVRKWLVDFASVDLVVIRLDGPEFAGLLVLVLIAASLLFVWLRICQALRTVRFANA